MTRVVETDETGRLVLPDDLLREIKPRTKYIIESKGDGLIIYPEEPVLAHKEVVPTPEQWEAQWRAAQEQVSKSWPAGVSAVDVMSEMRR